MSSPTDAATTDASLTKYLETMREAVDGGSELTLDQIGFGSMFAKKESGKLRFLLVSTHTHQFTGYSKVSHGFIQELSKLPWLSVTHYGFQRQQQVPPNYRPYPANVRVIDAASLERTEGGQGFGIAELPAVIKREQPDVVLIYNDMMIVSNFIKAIRDSGLPRTFKLWVYCDQVYNCQLKQNIDVLNRDADRVFAFSPYWKKCLKEQGVTRPIDVLLHGYSDEQFYPVPRDIVRKQLNIPKDHFLFINLNRNNPRKRYDLLIMAFVELILKHQTRPIYLLCVADAGDRGGFPLFEIFQRELKMRGGDLTQFGDRLMVTNKNMCFRDEDINAFYNAADAGVTTAEGEGWGLCAFEQMGVGVPQVVPAIGGFKEFCTAENSVLVAPKYRYYQPLGHCVLGGEAEVVDPHDYCMGMEEYVLNSEKRKAHGAAARETVLSYTWERAVAPLIKRLKETQDEKEDE